MQQRRRSRNAHAPSPQKSLPPPKKLWQSLVIVIIGDTIFQEIRITVYRGNHSNKVWSRLLAQAQQNHNLKTHLPPCAMLQQICAPTDQILPNDENS